MIEPDIIEVSWGKTINIGNFETVRYDLKARVNTGQDWREILQALRHLVQVRENKEREKYANRPETEG